MAEANDAGRPARGPRRRSRKRTRTSANATRTVPLQKRASSHFNRTDRQRGSELFRENRVRVDVENSRAKAQVKGKDRQTYGVGIDWSQVAAKRVLHVYCECPRFAGGKVCKHLWATLISLAENKSESQPPGDDRLALRKDRVARWRDLPSSESRNQNDSSSNRRTRAERQNRKRKGGPAGGRSRPNPAVDKASWRHQLSTLHDQVEKVVAESEAEKDDKSAADYRFLVNTGASPPAHGVVLDVFEGTRPSGKASIELKPASIDPETLDVILLPASRDQEESESVAFVTALPTENTQHGRGRRTSAKARQAQVRRARAQASGIRRLLLPRQLYGSVLPHLSTLGVLGWWDGRATSEPQPLSWDSGPAWNLALQLDVATADGTSRLRGVLERDGHSVPLERAILILPGRKNESHGPNGIPSEGAASKATSGNDQIEAAAASQDESDEQAQAADSAAPGSAAKGNRPAAGKEDSKAAEALNLQARRESSSAMGAEEGDTNGAVPERASFVLFADSLARLDSKPARDQPWIRLFRGVNELVIPHKDLEEALTSLLALPQLPRLDMPGELQLTEEAAPVQPFLVLESDPAPEWMNPPLVAELFFLYGEMKVSAGDPNPVVVDWRARRYLRRNLDREHTYLLRLLELGVQPVSSSDEGHRLEIAPDSLPAVAEPLLTEGWAVEVHGTNLRSPEPPSLHVESNIDWFELSGGIEFAGERIDLSAALDATARGDRFIQLADGSRGLLPAAWMETYDSLSKLSYDASDDGLRFLPSQALLVDALLTATPPAVDRKFAELREKLRAVEGIKPKKELKTFRGELRSYQRLGLGWLGFLREFGLGGVLADDMGLGKTVQVLALIHAFRTPAKTTGLPFLVVAPRSLIYNWIEEARRFTPKLSILEYSGTDRESLRQDLPDYDVVVTTYGTLRRDVGYLAMVEFDTIILDEAQAIKNRESQAAKASRLLQGRNRLALTGTPIENHLGELGSIFEFLNPGLFGRMPKLDALAGGRNPSQRELKLVAEGIRPFILRRTKAQVLTDLPPKTELTMHCTLHPRQREIYDQLRMHYQTHLLEKVEGQSVSGSAFQVLEALLRLRQIACHPGLVDPEWEEAGSAKLEALFSHVSEVLSEGHKVIVFSQFTKLLAYVQKELVAQDISYAYLDGSTRNRGQVVERFQTDPDCNLFLISLKAGGVGLNLTAAGYVFLLDPWWNPAVEAQAIDRAHRIGQTQPVFAYRLIARDTVEEKILELQRSKRQLADAILEGEGQMLRDLTADDLQMLLS